MRTVNDIERDIKRKIAAIEKRSKEAKDAFTEGRLFELNFGSPAQSRQPYRHRRYEEAAPERETCGCVRYLFPSDHAFRGVPLRFAL